MKLFAGLLILTILRLVYIGQMELSPDESYYHEWSKRLDLCYFSKGPGVAAAMKLSTTLFGHGEFGVRAFAPLLALGTSLLIYWLARRIFDSTVATWAVVALNVTPLFNAGGLVMSIDPLSIFFWTAAMCALWLALENVGLEQRKPGWAALAWWFASGLLIGAGFLCKWTNAFQLLSVVLLLALTRRYRRQFLKPGFYLMLLGFLPALVPVSIWQSERGWPVLGHLSARGGLETPWWKIDFGGFGQFIAMHFGAYSPILFLGMVIALWATVSDSLFRWVRAIPEAIKCLPRSIARNWGPLLFAVLLSLAFFFAGNFWELPVLHKISAYILVFTALVGWASRKEAANIHWKSRFLAAFAMPIVVVYVWVALHHDSEVNWTAPAAVSVIILTAAHFHELASKKLKTWTLALGVVISLVGIQPDLVRAVGIPWPSERDHTNRLRGWAEAAKVVSEFREQKEQELGRQIFIIAENYGVAAQLCYYLPPRPPEIPGHPACYVEESVVPTNQFHFWGRYDDFEERSVPVINEQEDSREYGVNRFAGRTAIYVTTRDESRPPSILQDTFESWRREKDVKILENGRVIRTVRFFVCHRYLPGKLLD